MCVKKTFAHCLSSADDVDDSRPLSNTSKYNPCFAFENSILPKIILMLKANLCSPTNALLRRFHVFL